MILAGIDEVGYGPKLGPFVVCAVAIEGPDVDLHRALGGVVPVADSKKLFTQARGLASIEPTALAYLGQLWPVKTHGALWAHLSPDPRCAPWYGDLPLPCETREIPVTKLREALADHRLRFLGAWARILEPADYNARVGGNKSELLFDCAADLVKCVHTAGPGRVDVAIGKQGGRRFYLRHIVRHFGAALVREETPESSVYETDRGMLSFLVDGEDRSFLIALASVIGKYVREVSMRLFNAYWAERVGVRPTAGYGLDARRFWREVEPHLATHQIRSDQVLRCR